MRLFYDDGTVSAEHKLCPIQTQGNWFCVCHMKEGLRCSWPRIRPPIDCPILWAELPEYHFEEDDDE